MRAIDKSNKLKMQRNYNDRNSVRKLHPLGVGDRVRIKTDKEKYWSDSGREIRRL